LSRKVAFVGPLPPPVNGFSNVCATMLAHLKVACDVRVFDRARCPKGPFHTLMRQMLRVTRYLWMCVTTRDVTLYVALSGGLSQIIDGMYFIISRLFGVEIFIHHHSFAYANASTLLNRMIFRLLRGSTHIVLSQGMGERLARTYHLNSQRIRVVSNAAMYADPIVARPSFNVDNPIRIGFISNLSVEKGLLEFFEVLDTLRALGIQYRAHLAGPVDASLKTDVDRLLSDATNTYYEGAVYADAKMRFYQGLDVLLFPTKYVNEAEPLVIHEALRASVHVVAIDRGAIAEILAFGAGCAFREKEFVEEAAGLIRDFSVDRSKLARAQLSSFEQAQRLCGSAAGSLRKLVADMSALRP
jgi:glycosyltransferase involved in cell wall biosynthesis